MTTQDELNIKTVDANDDGKIDAVVIKTNGDEIFVSPQAIKKSIKYLVVTLGAIVAAITGHTVIL